MAHAVHYPDAMRFRARPASLLFVVACAFSVASAMGAGCVSSPSKLKLGAGGDGSTGSGGASNGAGGAGGAVDTQKGHDLYVANVDPILEMSCTACHDGSGGNTPFIRGKSADERYKNVVSFPSLVTKNPSDSMFFTYAKTSQHVGGDISSVPGLVSALTDWLNAEAASIVTTGAPDAGKHIDPFAPIMGFNAMYLDPLGAEFKGMALTFTAGMLTAHTLQLTDIEVQPTAKMGVHMVHPLFTVYPKGLPPDPDPADSFSNVDQQVDADKKALLGPGELILTNWSDGARMSVAFEKLEPYSSMMQGDGGTDGGPTSGCTALADFQSDAKPYLQTCFGCHGGANPNAQNAVDMSQLGTDDAAACSQVKNRVKPKDAANSQIFITTDPSGGAAHPYKFNGDPNAFAQFKQDLTKWISKEQ